MSRIAYFDVSVGIAGDMALGALVDAGVPLEAIQARIDALGIDGLTLEARPVAKNGIRAMKVDVRAPHEHVHRGLSDIQDILRGSDLPEPVTAGATRVFEALAEAEAAVHGTTVDEIHFHEVGALDAIADVVGSVAGLHELGADRVACSPLPMSSGFVDCHHGRMPVPPPAVLKLVEGIPVRGLDVTGETVTPTGAALMVALASSWGPIPDMRVERVGHGAGEKDFAVPNLVRLVVGEAVAEGAVGAGKTETLTLLETNVDDMTPEWLGPLLERLVALGALDAWFTPIVMKKGRPSWTVSALATPASADAVRGFLFSATTTLGVRETRVERRSLERRTVAIETGFGPIRMKVATLPDGDLRASPEFDDCLSAADEHGVAVREVHEAAMRAWSAE